MAIQPQSVWTLPSFLFRSFDHDSVRKPIDETNKMLIKHLQIISDVPCRHHDKLRGNELEYHQLIISHIEHNRLYVKTSDNPGWQVEGI